MYFRSRVRIVFVAPDVDPDDSMVFNVNGPRAAPSGENAKLSNVQSRPPTLDNTIAGVESHRFAVLKWPIAPTAISSVSATVTTPVAGSYESPVKRSVPGVANVRISTTTRARNGLM